MTFGTLVAIVLAGLGGPLLALTKRWFVPVMIGEILAGIVIGPHLLGAVDPEDATVVFLGEVGFAMLMLSAGMHLPLRDPRLRASLASGGRLAAIVCALAVPAGLVAAMLSGGSHAAVFAVVLASGSAAVLVPALEEARLQSRAALTVMAQVTVADVLTIVSVPIVLQPERAWHAVLGAAVVVACVLGLIWLARAISGRAFVARVRKRSKQRRWALDLRLALLVLFLLAWLAQKSGTSILIAGFGAGVMVAVLGGPKRLSTQTRGVAEGFFIPLYFVVLGAGLDLGGLFSSPSNMALALALAALTVVIRLAATALTGGTPASAFAASAQLGVPAAVASVGLSEHVLAPVTATAIVSAALISLAVSTLGVELLTRAERTPAHAAEEGGEPPALRPSTRTAPGSDAMSAVGSRRSVRREEERRSGSFRA
jgi:Kef-type K+ transport system membrane component KefB